MNAEKEAKKVRYTAGAGGFWALAYNNYYNIIFSFTRLHLYFTLHTCLCIYIPIFLFI